MTKSRALSLALAPQLLSLIVLAQPWFTISMVVDGSSVQLGAFDGATTFPAASPIALLSLAAIAVAAISAARTRLLALFLLAIANLAGLVSLVPLILQRQISALDSQLDRLTGIANTHGLSNVNVANSGLELAWIFLVALTVVIAIWLLRQSARWGNEDKSAMAKPQPRQHRGQSKKPESSIDIWNNQRG